MATQTLALPAGSTRRRLRVGDAAAYVLTGFPLAVAAFVLLVAGFAVGVSTLAITVGIAVLAGTLGAARAFAGVERSRLDVLYGTRMPRPAYRQPHGGRLGRALSAGADPRRWLDLLHGILGFPIAVVTFSVVVTWFAAAVSGLGYVLWEWSVPRGDDHTLAYYLGLGDGRTADILLTTALGAVAAVTLPWVVRGCAAVQARLAWSLLAASADADAAYR
jgi:Putative sensor